MTGNGQKIPPDSMSLQALLAWYIDAGVDAAIDQEPLDRFALSRKAREATERKSQLEPAAKKSLSRPNQGTPRTAGSKPAEAASDANAIARACKTLEDLKAALEDYDACGLKRTAMSTVFSDGIKGASVMLIGEAPGADEDRQGKPFVGAAGKLLDRMLAPIGLSREENVYITNIVPWRPPGNRRPSPIEIEQCMPFIKRHIELARPDVIVSLGGTSAGALLQTETGITRLRGRWKSITLADREIPLLPIYHPAYLLRQPRLKGDAWRDLLELSEFLEKTAGGKA